MKTLGYLFALGALLVLTFVSPALALVLLLVFFSVAAFSAASLSPREERALRANHIAKSNVQRSPVFSDDRLS